LALTRGIFIPDEDEIGLGRLEAALDSAVEALKVETKIRDAIRAGRLDRLPGEMILGHAVAAGVITEAERGTVLAADEIRDEVIQVDAFDSETFAGLRG
jgi:acyl-CoA dehydrogenase